MPKKVYTADDIKISTRSQEDSTSFDITKDGFSANFELSVETAISFARSYISNQIPSKITYLLNLDASFPERKDYGPGSQVDESIKTVADNQAVIDLLWRDGKVPEWINVYLHSEDGDSAFVRIDCCSRYTDDGSSLYHLKEGKAPFHVLGPQLPQNYNLDDNSEKFDLNWHLPS